MTLRKNVATRSDLFSPALLEPLSSSPDSVRADAPASSGKARCLPGHLQVPSSLVVFRPGRQLTLPEGIYDTNPRAERHCVAPPDESAASHAVNRITRRRPNGTRSTPYLRRRSPYRDTKTSRSMCTDPAVRGPHSSGQTKTSPPTEARGPMASLPCDPATTFIVSPP